MLISIDIGTTNVKAVAWNDEGYAVAAAERANTTLTPEYGWSEQEPERVFRHTQEVLEAVAPKKNKVRAVVFSAAMHGLVALDKAGRPLTNFLLWSDLRADSIAKQLRQDGRGMEIYRRTGVPIHAMSPLCKLIWLRKNQLAVFQNTRKFMGIKEFVWHRLTGRYESDLSLASATGLLNIWTNNWDEDALRLAGISAEQLPQLVSPSTTFPATDMLPMLIIGASDGALANIGSGAMAPGQVAVTIGTSAAIRMVAHEPLVDEKMRTFCYRLDEGRCIVGGASNNGTNALEWLRRHIMQSELDADAFANQALSVQPGSDGLLFLPYLHGERAPLYDAAALGSFQGLSARHTYNNMVRAVMEGVLFNLKIIAEPLETRQPTLTLHAGGGFSKNQAWVQMLADIFQKPVWVNDEGADASVSGAMHLARMVLGMEQSPEQKRGVMVVPNLDHKALYEHSLRKFSGLLRSD